MKKVSYEKYLSMNNDNYVDVENPSDCSTRFQNEKVEIMVHKGVNKNDELEHWFDGNDENVCVVYKDSDIQIVYECTWEDMMKEYNFNL